MYRYKYYTGYVTIQNTKNMYTTLQQTHIDNCHPKNGHSEEIDYDRLYEFEKTYLVDHPDFPENYKKKKEEYFATHASNNSFAEHAIICLFINFCYGRQDRTNHE